MAKRCFFLATLGCKVNQYESRALCEAWLEQGWEETREVERAGLILVNSCAVTAKAVADVRGAVRRLHRAAPEAAVIITGCAAEVLEQELAELPGVVRVVKQSRKESLLGGPLLPDVAPAPPRPSEASFPSFSLSGYDRSRSVLKIQDGCSHGCTYCIVPLTRGRARSRPFAESLAEAERLLAAGFREIVISGVNLRQFHLPGKNAAPKKDGPDAAKGGGDFWDFLQRLDETLAPQWAGRARLRVSSLEPGQLTDKALAAIASCSLLSPHLHLSLQSASPSVLERMGRGHYHPGDLPGFLERLRAHWPVFGLGADLLTGFPEENDAEFEETLAFCEKLPLSYAHVFPYSRRPGTKAAAMAGQVPPEVKKERAARLRALVKEKKRAFLHELCSLPRLRVVFEAGPEQENPLDAEETLRAVRGVNEHYADCILEDKSGPEGSAPPFFFGKLTDVTPVAVRGETLAVRLKANLL